MAIGLLVLRVLVGGLFAAHGAQKLFGWFGGYGIKGTGGFFESLGYRPGPLMALVAGATGLRGGVAPSGRAPAPPAGAGHLRLVSQSELFAEREGRPVCRVVPRFAKLVLALGGVLPQSFVAPFLEVVVVARGGGRKLRRRRVRRSVRRARPQLEARVAGSPEEGPCETADRVQEDDDEEPHH